MLNGFLITEVSPEVRTYRSIEVTRIRGGAHTGVMMLDSLREVANMLMCAAEQAEAQPAQATNSAMDAMRELRTIMSGEDDAFTKCTMVREVLARHQ